MRPSVQVVLFLILLNGAAGVITASGLGAAMDINPEPGGDGRVEEINSTTSQVSPEGGARDTLFTLYQSVTAPIASVFQFIFYGPIMLTNLGVPSWITGFLFGGASLLVAVDIIHFLTGRAS